MAQLRYFYWMALSVALLCIGNFLVFYHHGSFPFKTFALSDLLDDNSTLVPASDNNSSNKMEAEEDNNSVPAINIESESTSIVPPNVSSPTPLLTIFTTLRDTPQKFYIHRNVIMNWASFGPKVQPVLFGNFTEDSSLRKLAVAHGWKILPQQRVNKDGTPFLKDMYRLARNLTDSVFYGFCNGDIVFNEGLIRTLEGVATYSAFFNSTLVIGRRFNVNVNEATMEPLYQSDKITWQARHHGRLYFLSAEDYFFISRPQLFPWHTIKDVVIGRPGYDNYLVGQAIRGAVGVVDATNTIIAVHQTGKDGNLAGSKNKDGGYNKRIIGRYNYHSGLTTSAQYITTTDYTGKVFLQKRQSKPKTQKIVKPKH